jgi:hypothetical protein
VKVTIHLHLVLRLRINGAIRLLSLIAFVVWTWKILPFSLILEFEHISVFIPIQDCHVFMSIKLENPKTYDRTKAIDNITTGYNVGKPQ